MAAAGGHWLKIAQGDIGKLVFVPKGQTAAGVITGRRPTGGGFPSSPGDTQVVKGLGGTTGAKLVQDDGGNLYVMKKGNSAGHLLDESAADKAYEALGVDVAGHKVYDTPGGPTKLAKFVEGQGLDTVQANDPAAYGKAVTQLQKGFAADAVLGNWDVIGASKDNVLIGTNGKVYRIDNGGSLRYRAQGKLKDTVGAPFDKWPMELFTMRTQGTAGEVFGKMKLGEIAKQAKAVSLKGAGVLKAMPNELKPIMTGRLARMSQFSNIYKTLSAKGLSDKSIEGYVQKLWGGLKGGKSLLDPKTPAEILASFNLLGGS